MEAIKATIRNVMQGLSATKGSCAGKSPEDCLKKVLTKKELKHIKFHYFRKGILGLYVDSSSWLYNFSLQKDTLLGELSQKMSTVKDIRFRIGEIR